jgi:hypothetical protein
MRAKQTAHTVNTSNESRKNAIDELINNSGNVNVNSGVSNGNISGNVNSSFTPQVNNFTNIQLNTVSDMMKKLKEKGDISNELK